jgi:polysaccharide biosynthesis/export protein
MKDRQMYFQYSALLLLAGALTMSAQDLRVPASAMTEADSAAVMRSNMAYEPVNPGDLVYVYVADYPEITRSYRVSQNGSISIPVFKEPLVVAGFTPSSVETAVVKAILDAKLLVRPVVSVAVLEYRSRPVQISGAVKHPITIQALGDIRLLDALAKSDGLDSDAGSEILVLRPGSEASTEPELHIPVQALLNGSDPQLNIELHGGEQIRVPRAGKLYVVGNVKNPGVFPFTEADGLSVLKAVGLCQGVLPFSHDDAILYRLVPETGKRIEITVHLREILKHRSADIALQPNDVFYVLDYAGKRLAANVIDKITGMGTAASTVLMWRVAP